jgi:transforming growth factor-beta-induced protein
MKSISLFCALFAVMVFGSLASETKAQKGDNLVEVALAVNGEGSPYEGQFDTLIAAVLAADPAVVETLTGRGQFTVFAPTDDAFAAVGIDTSNVGSLDREFLTQVLLYHVVRGRRDAGDVTTSDRIRSLQGTFFFPNSSATITDALGRPANIIVTDVPASNGIIHAIDAVILPYAP